MIVEEIRMLNFGPFYGEHKIVFANGGRGVHIIRGDNGQGKTSIQRAVLWALYGKVQDRKGEDIRPTSLLNRTAARDDIYHFAVVLFANHEDKKWVISRKMEARVHQDKKYNMTISVTRDSEPQPNPEEALRRMLPPDVKRFFFFDGEMLRDYEDLLDQSSTSMTILRDSIEHVLGIPYLRIASNDLHEVQRKIEMERGKILRRLGGENYSQLQDDFQTISEQIKDREDRIKDLESSIAKLDMDISDQKRKQADIESVKKLALQRIQIEKDIDLLDQKKSREQESLKKLTTSLYKSVLSRTAQNILAGLQQEHNMRMDKYNTKQKLLGHIEELEKGLASQKCKLCGTVLNETKMAEINAELESARLKIKDLTEIPEPNLEFEHHINRLNIMLSEAVDRDEFTKLDDRIFKIDHERAAQSARLDQTREQIKSTGIDEEEPRRIENEIERLSSEKGRLQGLKEAEAKLRLQDLEDKQVLDQRIAGIDQKEMNALEKRIDKAKSIADVFEAAIAVYRNERRAHVESLATEIFTEIRTKESFARLKINEQFGLNIITDAGTVLDRAEWRSAGEEQIVAIALIAALNRCAQIRAPVFMDTPFGRLDTKHGKRILTFLPKLADQVVLLVTDRELRKGDERHLKGSVKTDLTLHHKGEIEGCCIYETVSTEESE